MAFDRFPRYDELTAVLEALARDHPDLVGLESIGRSHEGRELWLVTVTDRAGGPPEDKPAVWIDASIHAVELAGTAAALHLIHHLVDGHGTDERATRALATRAFYVVPRLNPDGAELALADRPRYLRSSTRPWPWPDAWRRPGLHPEDVDGDGRILTMRVADPNGAWKTHPDEPRLLTRRAPDDGLDDGPFFRIFEEGYVTDHDGFTVPTPMPPESLDLNRNFPAGWGTNVTGSGDFPGSEPEIQAVLRAVTARPNVCIYTAFHTFGGVLLRPSSVKADRELPPDDVWTWKRLGRAGTELTGYPVHSVYEDFTWDPAVPLSGASDDWAYEHLGIYGWTVELWDVIRHVTGEPAPTTIWWTGPTVEHELAVLRWADDHAPGRLYVDWRPFDHPQLGRLEIGGWDYLRSWANPPPDLLEAEVEPHAGFQVFQALTTPRLEIIEASGRAMGDGVWRVQAGVANTGWLPTDVSRHARTNNLVLPAVAELAVPGGAELVGTPARVELGQLAGRSRMELDGALRSDGTPDRALAVWTVLAAAGAELEVTARHPRAGLARRRFRLGE